MSFDESHTAPGAKVLHAVQRPDRIPAKRYYDPEFYKLECEKLWPRVWQMACRLEEIPKPGDFVVYEILDQSIIVTRVDEHTVRAYHNACRHRGVKLASDRGSAPDGFTCRFHGWQWKTDGKCKFVFTPSLFAREQMHGRDLALVDCRAETWGGCVFINLDDDAPPLRDSIEPFATMHDAWHVESLRTEWWLAARLPVNWKLAMEAFMEGYHVMTTHPQLGPLGVKSTEASYSPLPPQLSPMARYVTVPAAPMPETVKSREFIEMNLHFMRLLSVGMAGMTHAKDVKVAESLVETALPERTAEAMIEWRKRLNDAVVDRHRLDGMDVPDLNDVDAREYATAVNFCFPHYFLLPTYGSASSYRIRPLGPEECLFELWSLTRYPAGVDPPPIKTPTPMAYDDPRWPPVPMQDFANLPLQQQGLHTKGFEFMRLSEKVEGLISNNHRLIDGYLAGLGYDRLLPAAHKVSGDIDRPIVDLGLE